MNVYIENGCGNVGYYELPDSIAEELLKLLRKYLVCIDTVDVSSTDKMLTINENLMELKRIYQSQPSDVSDKDEFWLGVAYCIKMLSVEGHPDCINRLSIEEQPDG